MKNKKSWLTYVFSKSTFFFTFCSPSWLPLPNVSGARPGRNLVFFEIQMSDIAFLPRWQRERRNGCYQSLIIFFDFSMKKWNLKIKNQSAICFKFYKVTGKNFWFLLQKEVFVGEQWIIRIKLESKISSEKLNQILLLLEWMQATSRKQDRNVIKCATVLNVQLSWMCNFLSYHVIFNFWF